MFSRFILRLLQSHQKNDFDISKDIPNDMVHRMIRKKVGRKIIVVKSEKKCIEKDNHDVKYLSVRRKQDDVGADDLGDGGDHMRLISKGVLRAN